MKIYADDIPSEGLEIAEEFNPQYLRLNLEQRGIVFTASVGAKARFTKTGREVFASLSLEAPVEYTCSRCLAKLENVFKKNFNFNYEVKPGDVLDIDEDIRQELILNNPMKTLCKPDCKGLCSSCGQNLNVTQCECKQEG